MSLRTALKYGLIGGGTFAIGITIITLISGTFAWWKPLACFAAFFVFPLFFTDARG